MALTQRELEGIRDILNTMEFVTDWINRNEPVKQIDKEILAVYQRAVQREINLKTLDPRK